MTTADPLDRARLARRLRAAPDRLRGGLAVAGASHFRALPLTRLAGAIALGLAAEAAASGQGDRFDAEPDDPRRLAWGPKRLDAKPRRRALTDAEWRDVVAELSVLRFGVAELAGHLEPDRARLAGWWRDRVAPLAVEVADLADEVRQRPKPVRA